jgi:serine/threonine-protein kinase
VELLGRGGTAEVWRAVDTGGREAALKILKPELRRQRGAPQLLRHEFAVLAAAASPCLVRPIELVQGGTALALEYLPGGDLVPLLAAPCRTWLPAVRAVAAALTALHELGLAHGDVKARNVLFAADGSARLVDLTAARGLARPAAVSTAAYRVPALPAATAREADAFAFAALIYELVAGRPPYGAAGAVRLGASPAPAAAPAGAATRLLAAAVAVLGAGGRAPCGFSALADVIESVDCD